MNRKRVTNSALGDALRQAGYQNSKNIEPVKSGAKREVDSDTGSASLDRLHKALASSAANGAITSPSLIPLAIYVARKGLLARTYQREAHVVALLIRRMGENLLNGTPGQAERSDLVLAMACLAGGKGIGKEIKRKLTRILVQAVLADRLPDDFVRSVARNSKELQLLASSIELDKVFATVNSERAMAEHLRRQELDRLRAIEETRRNSILEIRKKISVLKKELLSVDLSPEVKVESLREEDIQLVLMWGRRSVNGGEPLTLETAYNRLGSWEFTRLCSARSAELASAKFYEGLGTTVRDISVQQLDPLNNDWRTHDLMADSQPIDVKNARQSFSDPSRYSEYLVPKFKQERHVGHGVTIVAVLSRYMTAIQIRAKTNAECTILGEVTKEELDGLTLWVNSSFDGVLTARNFSAGGRLPGWCFEYKWRDKKSTNIIADEINELVNQIRQRDLSWNEVEFSPMFISFVDDEEIPKTFRWPSQLKSTPDQDFRLWERLLAVQSSLGWSRRSLFLFVIGYTLAQVKAGVEGWSPGRFNEFLFIDSTPKAKYWPLGLHDPLGYVAGIVSAMDVLWESSRKMLNGFVSFRMTSPWILLGTDKAGIELTILAYCGGWIQIGKTITTKCGLSPLVIGNDQSCPHCKRLICHECDFCSEGCARMTSSEAMMRNER